MVITIRLPSIPPRGGCLCRRGRPYRAATPAVPVGEQPGLFSEPGPSSEDVRHVAHASVRIVPQRWRPPELHGLRAALRSARAQVLLGRHLFGPAAVRAVNHVGHVAGRRAVDTVNSLGNLVDTHRWPPDANNVAERDVNYPSATREITERGMGGINRNGWRVSCHNPRKSGPQA